MKLSQCNSTISTIKELNSVIFKDLCTLIIAISHPRAGGGVWGLKTKSKNKKYANIPYNGDRNADRADCMKHLWGETHNVQIQTLNENSIFHRFVLKVLILDQS